jgi:dUTP pyrophosphatase
MIKFEKCKGYEDIATIPKRATKGSAGYDFYNTDKTVVVPAHGTVKIATGIKAYMDDDIVLMLYVRSSVGIKKLVVLSNGTGIIDSSYVDNPDNEGNIIMALHNTSNEPQTIAPYERVMQGVFVKYYTVDDDNVTAERVGGIGSTGK